ncbi:prostaglandin reductase 1-like [Spodoptera frugiperda]|uniref:Prostaglandin reductase 1 n=1 Tax=Spodoptera frugiperda TaxID=7108 RepID=A0A9R0EHA4_SPOFR|nr:prostaglandin reductase 1-like [Spodoptera frugiperda]
MVKARKYVVKNYFEGYPKREDYEIVEYELPPLKNGEVLVKVEWVSVDPYMRAYNSRKTLPYDQSGFQVGLVEESKDPRYPVGSRIISHSGWCDYCIIKTFNSSETIWDPYKLPKLQGLSNSLAIGALGMPGATAYFGFLEVCKPKAGETVVVSGAAGAVGSLVGQIAKIKGCKVIGFAGSDDKVKWLEEIGFDRAINYKTADIAAALKEAAPNGVDCYFDNVGGEVSNSVISQMNTGGRISVCGAISSYNGPSGATGNIPLMTVLYKQLLIQGIYVDRWFDRLDELIKDGTEWIKSGKLQPREHITEGFENIFDAFVGMLKGDNYGKAVVKL